MRLGIIGIDNSHADHAVRHLNVEHVLGAARVVAVHRGAPERVDALTAGGGIAVLDQPEDMIGQVDAAIVMDRHGAVHRAHAEPLLAAGIPVFVDKPLALSSADAEALLAAAAATRAPVSSWSPLRWVAAMVELRERIAELGEIRTVVATGPVQRESPYGGVAFYGVHAVEMALHLLPPLTGDPVVSVGTGGVVAVLPAGSAHGVVNLVDRSADAAVPFHIEVVGTRGVIAETVALGKDYTLPSLRLLQRMVETGEGPLSPADLLAAVRVVETISAAV